MTPTISQNSWFQGWIGIIILNQMRRQETCNILFPTVFDSTSDTLRMLNFLEDLVHLLYWFFSACMESASGFLRIRMMTFS